MRRAIPRVTLLVSAGALWGLLAAGAGWWTLLPAATLMLSFSTLVDD